MAWIKRNLLFVVGLAVAVALLGSGVFYLLGSQKEADDVNTELKSQNDNFDTLVNRKPAPTKENIKLAQEQQVRLRKFRESAVVQFAPTPIDDTLDDSKFKALLDATLDRLEKTADRSGVKLPKVGEVKFGFTFEEQRKQLSVSQKSVVPLTMQLLDVAELCQILFDAKIHSIESIKRTGVNTNDVTPTSNYLTKKPTTNAVTGAVVYPYELIFQCFSSELGAVLGGMVNAKQAYVVKTINVERGSTDTAAPVAAAPTIGGMNAALAARYGLGGAGMAARYGMAPPPAATPATRPGEPILDDKPLRITLGIEVVKLAATPPPTAQPAAPKAKPVR